MTDSNTRPGARLPVVVRLLAVAALVLPLAACDLLGEKNIGPTPSAAAARRAAPAGGDGRAPRAPAEDHAPAEVGRPRVNSGVYSQGE
ncbi:hypothetical protein ACFV4M_28360, partial [Kitasatospora indigofera]|uniref:hypothetical protein n=1 Tax=Kitasatospora indigofera TaxID=67307 RepID=UPI003659C5D1